MAFSCVRVGFELGHEASLRTKRTAEGFTHDWEVYVRGTDGADISQFVERVVFTLHETFLNSRRVVREPPYSVRESGYAGFMLPIEIVFRNTDEPRRVRYNYDLTLQTSGPPISMVVKERFTFPNPSEELRRRLIRGGGMGVTGSELPTAPKVVEPARDEPRFTPAYVSELRALQQRIMSLESNSELQQVVRMISQTGRFEITKKTFDFDLCALDRATVQRLMDLLHPPLSSAS